MGAGGCPAVMARWQSTGGSSQVYWVRLPATAGFFTYHFCDAAISRNVGNLCANYILVMQEVPLHVNKYSTEDSM